MGNFVEKQPPWTAVDIATAATYEAGEGFILQHNNKAVLLVSQTGPPRISDGTTAIADGVTVGQLLRIIVIYRDTDMTLSDNANTKLRGDWHVDAIESWLDVVWDGSDWLETGRGGGAFTASGLSAYAEGTSIASGVASHAEGSGTTASEVGAHSEGITTTASGSYSHAEGQNCVASGLNSHAAGNYALANQKDEYACGGGRFTSSGDTQYRRFVCRRALTPAATAAVIGIDTSAIGPVIGADTAWTFRAEVIGISVDGGAIQSATIEGCLKRAGATVSAPSAATVTVLHADDADIVFTAVADDTNKSLNISVTDATNGAVAYRFVATIHITQITFT